MERSLGTAFVVAFFVALAALIGAVNHWGWANHRFVPLPALAQSGDEPHYLMLVNSLLSDRDLELTQDYGRVGRGGWDAGERFRYAQLDHHTVLVDRVQGKSLLWQEVFDWRKRECRELGCEGFRRLRPEFPPGAPRSEVSAHPVGYAAAMALLLSPFSPTPRTLEPDLNRLMQLLCLLGALLVYGTVHAASGSRAQALLAAALLALASPWLPYSRSFFVELPAGVCLIAGLFALQKRRPFWAGVAVGVAFSFKPLFLVFGAGWGAERLLARRWRDAFWMALPLGVLGLAVAVHNLLAARRLVIAGTSPWAWADRLSGVHAQLFDAAHGVVPFAPWVLLAFLPLVLALVQPRGAQPLHVQLALPTALYVGLLVCNAYLGETCYGPRYWIPLLPLLAVAASEAGKLLPRRAFVACLAVLGGLGLYIAVPASLRYPKLWDQPATAAWDALP